MCRRNLPQTFAARWRLRKLGQKNRRSQSPVSTALTGALLALACHGAAGAARGRFGA